MLFSVIVVTHSRLELLKNFLESFHHSIYKFNYELFIVINGSDPETEEWLSKQLILGQVINAKSTTPAAARNLAINQAKGDFLCFFDDDVFIPQGYFKTLSTFIKSSPESLVIGGPDRSPIISSAFQDALGMALTSPMATASTRWRHLSKPVNVEIPATEMKLILCNLIISASIFKEGIRFDERYFRNEENVLLHMLDQKDISFFYNPELYVYHSRKKDFKSLWLAVFSSGRHRLKSFKDYPDSRRAVYFVPLLFVIYLALLILFPIDILKIPLLIYLIAGAVISFYISAMERKIIIFPLVWMIQMWINLAYGLGFFWEIMSLKSKD